MYKKERVNVIMPVYNEEATIAEIMGRVLAQRAVDRLIIVDDGSSDRSPGIIKALARRDKRITFLSGNSNMGKGHAVRRGLRLAKEGIIIIQDADLEYYPEDYARLLKKLDDDTFVLGARIKLGTRSDKARYTTAMAIFANAMLTSEFNIVFGKSLTDINTCYKIFKRKMIDDSELRENGFLIDPEILVTLVRKGYRAVEVDIKYNGRTFREGKKITPKDAIEQGLFILGRRFG